MENKIKIARVATVPFALLGSRSILKKLSNQLELQVVCSDGQFLNEIQTMVHKKIHLINLERKISLFKDLKSLWELFLYFRKNKFDIVHSNTPKAGIVCALASFFARVPIRIHTFTGQRWATMKGPKKFILKSCDRIIVLLNTKTYADSDSQIKFLEENKIPLIKPLYCLGKGGFSGVDQNRFNRSEILKKKIQAKDNPVFSDDGFTIGFVGRIVKEKGIETLLAAHKALKERNLLFRIILIGPMEESLDPISKEWKEYIHSEPSIYLAGFRAHPEELLVECDILCLPSFREGFPMVVIESASIGLPAIVSKIPGNVDTIVENETGLFFEREDVDDLIFQIAKFIEDPNLVKMMGDKAKERVDKYFNENYVDNLLISEYKELYTRL